MPTECGLTNLAVCLPEKFFQFILSMLNTALEPLLNLTTALLTEPVNLSTFHSLWVIIVYIISLFYGLFFLFAGCNFIISGYDPHKRENAKIWLKNVIFMIIFIQASFFLYELIIELSALLTTGVMDIIDPQFFLLRADRLTSLGLQLVLLIPYLFVLFITTILLGLRYLFVSIGVVLLPFGIFFYFIPPLKGYGRTILHTLGMLIFITFFDAIILFGASELLHLALFDNYSTVVTIIAFVTIDALMIFLMLFAIIKGALSVLDSDVGKNIARAAKYLG